MVGNGNSEGAEQMDVLGKEEEGMESEGSLELTKSYG